MLAAFTPAERVILGDYKVLTSKWRVRSAAELESYGIVTNWLLYRNTPSGALIPLFQLEVQGGRLVSSVLVQTINRILSQTRTMREIAIWWLAAHDLLSEFPDSSGQIRSHVSPRMALLDARLSACLIGAARRTIARDVTINVGCITARALSS